MPLLVGAARCVHCSIIGSVTSACIEADSRFVLDAAGGDAVVRMRMTQRLALRRASRRRSRLSLVVLFTAATVVPAVSCL